jgi:hypothetical protein
MSIAAEAQHPLDSAIHNRLPKACQKRARRPHHRAPPERLGPPIRSGRFSRVRGARRAGIQNDALIDTEGARALAARIAAGPPDQTAQDPAIQPSDGRPAGSEEAEDRVQIVRMKQTAASKREVRVFVMGPDGRLVRRR